MSFLLISFFVASGTPAAAKSYSMAQKIGCIAAVLGTATVVSAWHEYTDLCKVQNQPSSIDGFLAHSFAEFKNAHSLTAPKSTSAKLLLGAEAFAAAAVGFALQSNEPVEHTKKAQVIDKNVRAQHSFKVMSSNILGEIAYEKYIKDQTLKVDFKTRSARFRAFVRDERPDLIGFQEVDLEWQKFFPDLLKGYGVVVAPGNLSLCYKKTLFRPLGKKYCNKDAKVLSQAFIHLPSKQKFVVINIHAPWGQGKQSQNCEDIYQQVINHTNGLPVLAMGDWNTDGNPNLNGNKEILEGLFIGDRNGFEDLTGDLDCTARSVHHNGSQKIDYITARGFEVVQPARSEPPLLEHLLPHAQGGTFNVKSSKNHYSDHAAVLVEVRFPVVRELQAEPRVHDGSAGGLPLAGSGFHPNGGWRPGDVGRNNNAPHNGGNLAAMG